MSKKNSMITTDRDIFFEVVWERVTPELVEEVGEFWVAEGAKVGNPQELEARAQQLIVLARNEDGEIIAVNSAERRKVPGLLDNIFYYYRVFVANNYRKEGLMMSLSHKARKYLHARFVSGEDTVARGFYVEIESPILQLALKDSVMNLGGVKHSFVGVDEYGRHLRVGWFDGATID